MCLRFIDFFLFYKHATMQCVNYTLNNSGRFVCKSHHITENHARCCRVFLQCVEHSPNIYHVTSSESTPFSRTKRKTHLALTLAKGNSPASVTHKPTTDPCATAGQERSFCENLLWWRAPSRPRHPSVSAATGH